MKTVFKGISGGQNLWPGLVLICLGIAILFPSTVFQGKAIAPGDLQFLYHPWRTEFEQEITGPGNWILFDEILEFYPWREFLKTSLQDGKIPLWDSTAFCGYPFQGLFQTALLYPPDRLTDPLPYNFYTLFRASFHILLAGLGIGLYLKHRKFGTPSITFGMCAYALCGFMIVWIGHPHAKVAAWLPLLFLGIDLLLEKHKHAFLILLIPTVMTFTAGHIETALHTLSAAAAYFLFSLVTQPTGKKRVIVIISTIMILSILLAGAMILPFTEYLSRSVAYATRSDGVITQGWLDPILSLAILMPDVFGNSARGTYWYPDFNTAEIGGAFIGSITAVFALAALLLYRREKLVIKHGILALVSGFIAFGIPPVYQIVTCLPGYKMSYNFRMVLPMVFSMAVLGAFMIDKIMKDRKWKFMIPVSCFPILLCLVGVFLINRKFPQIDSVPFNHFLESSVLIVVGCIFIPFIVHKSSGSAGFLFTAILLFELLSNSYGFNPETSLEKLETLPSSAKYLSVVSKDKPFRSLPLGKTYPPHMGSRFNMHDIRGNDALTPLITEDYIALIKTDMRDKHNLPALRMMWMNTWQSPLLDALNIKYFAFPVTELEESPAGLIPFRTMGGVHLFENPNCLGRAFLVNDWKYMDSDEAVLNKLKSRNIDLSQIAYLLKSDTEQAPSETTFKGDVHMLNYSSHEISMNTRSESKQLLVLSDTYYPGWHVLVNGKLRECLRVNHMMRGIWLDKGDQEVKFIYQPVSWRLGLFLTLIGCMLTVIFGMLTKRQEAAS